MSDSLFTYLALGDSYTIGEGLDAQENFPHQAVALMNSPVTRFSPPIVIAKTGWTTDELDAAIDDADPKGPFDFVSLLIGVNNQYRGRSESEYKVQFDHLLQRAIAFAGNKATHVKVLSIPDWGITPYAAGRDPQPIANAIDRYNAAAKKICEQHQVVFIDITTDQRKHGAGTEWLVEDGLHPSGREYGYWAKKLAAEITKTQEHE